MLVHRNLAPLAGERVRAGGVPRDSRIDL